MTTQDALRTMIEVSSLSDDLKSVLIEKIDSLSEEEMMTLGASLTETRKKELAANEKAAKALETFLATPAPEQPVAEASPNSENV